MKYSYELQNLRGKWLLAQSGFANHLALIANHILHDVGAERKAPI